MYFSCFRPCLVQLFWAWFSSQACEAEACTSAAFAHVACRNLQEILNSALCLEPFNLYLYFGCGRWADECWIWLLQRPSSLQPTHFDTTARDTKKYAELPWSWRAKLRFSTYQFG